MLGFGGQKGLGECVCDHIVHRAVNELEFAISNDLVDEMKSDVNIFQLGMVLVVLGKCDD
jgi:hypothetical protein